MNNTDIPLLKKSYETYKLLNEFRKIVPRQHRFTIFSRIEDNLLDLIEGFYKIEHIKPIDKQGFLKELDIKLKMIRMEVRLLKDIRGIDEKKYLILQSELDEIGRMLGGWIKYMS